MTIKHRQLLLSIPLTLFMMVLLLCATYLESFFKSRMGALEFGFQTLLTVILPIILSAMSGFVLAFFILACGHGSENNQSRLTMLVFLSIIPALALIIKLSLAMYGPSRVPFALLGPYRFQIIDWILNSQVPSFWLGIVVGWVAK